MSDTILFCLIEEIAREGLEVLNDTNLSVEKRLKEAEEYIKTLDDLAKTLYSTLKSIDQ